VPLCLLDGKFEDAQDGLAPVDIELKDGRIAAVGPRADHTRAQVIDQDGGQVWSG
jgi:dihydroorotase-like cyclic amidohydrolase